MNRFLYRAFTALMTAAICLASSAVFSFGSIPDDNTFDCVNTFHCPTCPYGSGGGAHGGGVTASTSSAGGTGGCYTAPCNSPVRASAFGGAADLWKGGGVMSRPSDVALPSDANLGKRIVNLMRQDCFLEGNGGLSLQIARVYNNMTWSYNANDRGDTCLGPKWTLNYDMYIKPVTSGDTFLRRPGSGQAPLYDRGNNTWTTNASQGEILTLTKNATEWKLTTVDPNVWYTFDLTYGRIKTHRVRNGHLLRFMYTDGLLTRVDLDHETNDIDDRYLTLEYTTTSKTRLHTVHLGPSGDLVAEYSYDAYGMLSGVENKYGEMVEQYVNGPIYFDTDPIVLHEVKGRSLSGSMVTQRKYEYASNREVVKISDGAGSAFVENEIWSSYQGAATLASGIRMEYDTNYARCPNRLDTYNSTGRDLSGEPENQTPGQLVGTQYQTFVSGNWGGGTSMMLESSSDSSGNETEYEFINKSTNAPPGDQMFVRKVTKANGTWVEYGYDANYNITTVTKPLGRVASYGYDSQGNKTWVRDPMGNTTHYTYDMFGRVICVEDAMGGTVQHAYNNHGLVTVTTGTEGRASVRVYDSRDRLLSQSALGVTTQYAYDARDRLTTVTDGLNQKTVYAYDNLGRRTGVTDPMGNTTQYTYDTTGTLRNVIDAADEWTTNTYDFWGRLTSFTDQRGKTTTYEYDEEGHLVRETNPLGKSTQYTYHDGTSNGCSGCGGGAGKLASKTTPDGKVTSFTYVSGRLHQIIFHGPNGIEDFIEHAYDDAGRLFYAYDSRMPEDDLPYQGYIREFDLNDRLTTLTCPSTHEILYSYDALGRRTSMTDPDGNVTEYHYSNTANDKKLAYIEHPFSGRTNYFYSQDKGLLTEEWYDTFHLMLGTAWAYDAMNRVSSIEVVNPDTSAIYHREAYTYDANSMRTRVDYQVSGQPNYHRLYSYDPVLRLTEQHKRWDANNASAWRYAYEYDPAGNRTEMVHFDGSTTRTVTSSYNDGNQLTQNSDGSYVFDDNGNMVEQDLGDYSKHYRHDRENRLVQFEDEDSGAVVDYVYDTAGQRILREENGNKLLYFFDGLNVLMIKEKPAGCTAWRTKNTYTLKQADIGQIISEREYSYPSGCGTTASAYLDRWYQFDLLGNTVCTTLAGGSIEQQMDMEAFGAAPLPLVAAFGMTTKDFDLTSKLHYFNARWYASRFGRFVEKTPIPAGMEHSYVIAENRPQHLVDARGLFAIPPSWLPPVACQATIVHQTDRDWNGAAPYDKFKHCLAMCRIARECCKGDPFCVLENLGAAVIIHEGCKTDADSVADGRANNAGAGIGLNPCNFGKSCEQACGERFPSKSL